MSNGNDWTALEARAAALDRWARVKDRTKATEPGRKAAMARFERMVDPEGALTLAERQQRAQTAQRAHMLRMSQASADSRARKRGRAAS